MDVRKKVQMVARFNCHCCKRTLRACVWRSIATARCCGIDWQATINEGGTWIDEVRILIDENAA